MKPTTIRPTRRSRCRRGTTTLEWALVCGLLVIGAIAALSMLGPKVSATWSKVAEAVDGTAPGSPGSPDAPGTGGNNGKHNGQTKAGSNGSNGKHGGGNNGNGG
jgi:Flp pilus assembly pilin Flp